MHDPRTDGNYARAWQEAVAEIERLRARLDETRECPICKQAGDPFAVERVGMCTFCVNSRLDSLFDCRRLLREALQNDRWRYGLLTSRWAEEAAHEVAGAWNDFGHERMSVTIQQERDLSQERWRQVREQQAEIERLNAQLLRGEAHARERIALVEENKQQQAEIERLCAERDDESDCWNALEDVGHRLQVAVDSMSGMSLPEQIEHGLTKAARFAADLAECRRLLREAVHRLDYPEIQDRWGGWIIAARAAGGE